MALESLQAAWNELQDRAEGLAGERQWFAEFFELAPEACLITDRYAMIRSANAAAAVLLNRARRYLPGKPLAVFVPFAERRDFRRRLSRIERHARWSCSAFVVDVRRSPAGLCWTLR